jgi:hypothetical protein
MACAALVQVGPARQSFWALLDRRGGGLRERTRLLPRRGELRLEPALPGTGAAAAEGSLLIDDLGVRLELALSEEPGLAVVCRHGAGSVWTRKQAGIRATGTLRLDGGPAWPVRARAVVDDTAGHHDRATEWRWSAGVGESPMGAALAWNLVSGVNDPPCGSERAVWVGGAAREAPPVSFAEDLSRVECDDGSALGFVAEAERSRSERWGVFASDYRAPFGTFSGTLPGGHELALGLGVMEWHRARW